MMVSKCIDYDRMTLESCTNFYPSTQHEVPSPVSAQKRKKVVNHLEMCKFNLQIHQNWSKMNLAHETLIVDFIRLISMPSFWEKNPKTLSARLKEYTLSKNQPIRHWNFWRKKTLPFPSPNQMSASKTTKKCRWRAKFHGEKNHIKRP